MSSTPIQGSPDNAREVQIAESITNLGVNLESEQGKRILERIRQIRDYVPKVGVLGKTGAGKSSLCNALFGKQVAEISDVAACTRAPQQILLSLSGETGGGLILVDVPGVGESQERDIEYAELYQKLLPELDVVLWVIKADDRALSVDEEFFEKCIAPFKDSTPVVFVLNQVDKVAPLREWRFDERQPGPTQLQNIHQKTEIVAATFVVPVSEVCAVSAEEQFGLMGLVEHIVNILPNEKKFGFVREAKEETVSEESVRQAEKGIWDSIKENFEKALDFYQKNKTAIHAVIGTLWKAFKKAKA